MIIEFFGISGVGKTTTAKKYRRLFLEQGKNVIWDGYGLYSEKSWLRRNLIKAKSVTAYGIRHLDWCYKLYILLRKKAGLNIKDIPKLFFNGIFLKFTLGRCINNEDIYFIDEGILQYIWAICLRKNSMIDIENLKEFVGMFRLGDKIFIVEAEALIIKNRLISRNEKTKILESKDLLQKIMTMKKIQDEIVCELCNEKFISKEDIVCINNNEECELRK